MIATTHATATIHRFHEALRGGLGGSFGVIAFARIVAKCVVGNKWAERVVAPRISLREPIRGAVKEVRAAVVIIRYKRNPSGNLHHRLL